MYRTPENTPRQDNIQPPNPPVRNNIQYIDTPTGNDLRGFQIPQNLNQNNNPQEGNNRPNLAPRNNPNLRRRF